MPHPITSRKRAQAYSTALFFIGLAALSITQVWWPFIMLVVGIPLALRQYLLGRTYDMSISLLVFLGTFITVQFDITWRIFLPILFTIGALYILVREFLSPNEEDVEEQQENVQHEIEEDKKP